MESDYKRFLNRKLIRDVIQGIDADKTELNSILYDFQKDIVKWALSKGRAAIFADCGLGKTAMQLEWASVVCARTGGNVLILAPLAVAPQTKREGEKFGVSVNVCASMSDVIPGINITNYEKLDKFDPSMFVGIVLDESSILKSMQSKTREKLIETFAETPYRLCCTATPAPNDYMELANHSEFLGIMKRQTLLPMFFCHNGGKSQKWELKGHAGNAFWEFLSTWAVVVENPRDLGYPASGFDLPELRIRQTIVAGTGMGVESLTLSQRRAARRETIAERSEKAAEIAIRAVRGGRQAIVWCDLNAEGETVRRLVNEVLPGAAAEIRGTTKERDRLKITSDFTEGRLKCLVTKPSIAGFGMNWQNCSDMVFLGLSDSYEMYYQAVRRCWRFGQENPVDVDIVISGKEGPVLENIRRKDRDAQKMKKIMVAQTKEQVRRQLKLAQKKDAYDPRIKMVLPNWREFNECLESVS